MTEGGAARDVARHSWEVYVTKAVLFVAQMALFLKNAELGTHGRVVRFSAKGSEHIGDGALAALVEHVHDLAFTAGESSGCRCFHGADASFIARMLEN